MTATVEAERTDSRRGLFGNPERLARLLIIVTWSWVMIPALVQTIASPKLRTSIGSDDQGTTGLATLLTLVLVLALIALCLAIIATSIGSVPEGQGALLFLLLAPWIFSVGRNLYVGDRLRRSQLVYPLLMLAFWFLRPRLRVLSTLGYLVVATTVVSLFLGEFLPSRGIFQSAAGVAVVTEKQVFSSGILVGPFTAGNTLAQFLIMGLPSVFLIGNRWVRWAGVLLTAYALLWASSRSCLFALVAIAALAIGLRVVPRVARGLLGGIGISLMALGVVFIPLVTSDPEAFTNRGYIWQVSLSAWYQSPIVGQGTNYYAAIAATSENLGSTVYHAHNQFLQLLVQGGVVLAALVSLLFLVVSLRSTRAAREGENFGLYFVVAVLGASLLEVSFAMTDRLFFIPVMAVPLAVLALTPSVAQESSAPGRPQSAHLSDGPGNAARSDADPDLAAAPGRAQREGTPADPYDRRLGGRRQHRGH